MKKIFGRPANETCKIVICSGARHHCRRLEACATLDDDLVRFVCRLPTQLSVSHYGDNSFWSAAHDGSDDFTMAMNIAPFWYRVVSNVVGGDTVKRTTLISLRLNTISFHKAYLQ